MIPSMRGRTLLLSILLAILPIAGTSRAAAAEISLSIERTSPGRTASLALDGTFHVEVAYRSPMPLRIRGRPENPTGPGSGRQMTNASILHPAGTGRALTWIAFREPARTRKVTISAHDDDGNLVASTTIAVDLVWQDSGKPQPTPGWVTALRDNESRIRAEQRDIQEDGPWGLIASGMISVIFLSVPGYFVLQLVVLRKLEGGWQVAALAPLLLMVPAGLHALFALSSGSNLWPIVLIFAAPVGFLYLLVLWGARLLSQRAL